MSGNRNAELLGAEIRRQIGRPDNARILRALPQFRVEDDLPEHIMSRLRELERREAGQNGN